MANRRMFSRSYTSNCDLFHELTSGQRALYYDLLGEADDDGMIGNATFIIKYNRAKPKDLQKLIDIGYLIRFDTAIVAITHWHIHNKIPKDRYTPTKYQQEYHQLVTKEDLYIKANSDYLLPSGIGLGKGEGLDLELGSESVVVDEQNEQMQKEMNTVIDKRFTTNTQEISNILELWQRNRATISLSKKQTEKAREQIALLIVTHSYESVAEVIYKMHTSKYFYVKRNPCKFDFFVKSYEVIASGKYGTDDTSLDFDYWDLYDRILQEQNRLPFSDTEEQEQTEEQQPAADGLKTVIQQADDILSFPTTAEEPQKEVQSHSHKPIEAVQSQPKKWLHEREDAKPEWIDEIRQGNYEKLLGWKTTYEEQARDTKALMERLGSA